MKRTILLTISFLFLGLLNMQAQDNKQQRHEQRIPTKEKVKKMTKELNLTEDQQKEVTHIFMNTESRLSTTNQDNKEAKQDVLREERIRLKIVLTPEQYNKYMETHRPDKEREAHSQRTLGNTEQSDKK